MATNTPAKKRLRDVEFPKWERTSITLPRGTLEAARKAGVNVSAISSMALQRAIKALGEIS